MIQIVIGNKSFYADGYIPNPKEKSIQFYRERYDLDYMPPIKTKYDMLSDFGKEILKVESEVSNDTCNKAFPRQEKTLHCS